MIADGLDPATFGAGVAVGAITFFWLRRSWLEWFCFAISGPITLWVCAESGIPSGLENTNWLTFGLGFVLGLSLTTMLVIGRRINWRALRGQD